MRRLLTLCCAALLLAAPAAFGKTAPKRREAAEAQIRAVLDSTAEGWNRGDLQKYLSAYTDSATEMGPNGPEGGRDAIERTMLRGFWKTGRPVQQLRYEHVEVRMLGREHALVTGQFVLTGAGRPDRTGWFTTVWTRTRKGWRMIHDHS
ncbi:MAG TPA: nuclear transport factor 2 family protein [Pyrinomonadaceae bacterium]|jgi:uncharacterized protein (TIGR02246 family)